MRGSEHDDHKPTAPSARVWDNLVGENSLGATLLATRLSPPIPRSQLVHRNRLTERLWAGMHCKLTLVVAPAGYGKTTLLGEWLTLTNKVNWPAAWISLDRGSNNPLDFWTYVAKATQQIIPELTLSAYIKWGVAEDAVDHQQLAPVINQIASSPHQFCLILDDFHEIENDSIHRHLSYLISCLPDNMHIVISSREIPPISLSRLRVSNQLVEIKADDLLFNLTESEAFLCRIMNLRIAPDDITKLVQKTEGWITGLQIAALSMKDRHDPARFINTFDGNHFEMLDYLTEEILNQQRAPIKEFLLKTSILSALSAPLCDYVLGIEDSHEKLSYMEAANLFTIPLDDRRRWYRYHTLFAELLRSQLKQVYPDEIPALHLRTSIWLSQNGFPENAVRHAITGGDPELAARIVEGCVSQADYQIQYGDLCPLINLLPEAMIHQRPKLAIFEVRANIFLGRSDLAAEKLDLLPDLIRNDTSGSMLEHERELLLRETQALRAAIDCLGSDYEHAIAIGANLLDTFPTDEQYGGMLSHMLAYSYYCAGKLDEAAEAFNRGAQMSARRNCYKPIVLSLSERGRIFQRQGHLSEAEREYQYTLAVSQEAGLDAYFSILPQTGLGDLYREWNDLEAAERWLQPVFEYFEEVESVNEQAKFREMIWIYPIIVSSLLGKFLLTKGDCDGAAHFYRKASRSLEVYQIFEPLKSELIDMQTRLWLARKNTHLARQWVQEKLATSARNQKLLTTTERASMMRILLADNRPEAALKLADQLEADCRAKERGARLIETLILKALALEQSGAAADAIVTLKRALELAEPEGWIRLFVDEGKAIEPLLTTIYTELQRRPEKNGTSPRFSSGYVRKLLAALSNSPVTLPDRDNNHQPEAAPTILSPMAEPLSPRELEVLSLLISGQSIGEISERLVIAKSTTKVHIRNIYQKLNVNNRKEALERAVEWNVLG